MLTSLSLVLSPAVLVGRALGTTIVAVAGFGFLIARAFQAPIERTLAFPIAALLWASDASS